MITIELHGLYAATGESEAARALKKRIAIAVKGLSWAREITLTNAHTTSTDVEGNPRLLLRIYMPLDEICWQEEIERALLPLRIVLQYVDAPRSVATPA